jgi:hypothetical protein
MEKTRTTAQNKSLHKLFADVAAEMLALGIERRTVMRDLKGYDCPIDEAFLKEVWRSIQYTQTGKISTTQLTTSEIQKVYDTFNKFLGEFYHLHLPWPSYEAMMFEEHYEGGSM